MDEGGEWWDGGRIGSLNRNLTLTLNQWVTGWEDKWMDGIGAVTRYS